LPRVYLSPTEFSEMPIGAALANQINAMGTGVLDKMLARASQRCDIFCEKRLQQVGSTTLASGVSAGQSSLSLNSTLTLDNLAEQAAMVDYGNTNQETVLIQPGGVSVSSWASPYPGTVQLATPLVNGHSNAAPVQFCYVEVREASKASQSDPYSEALMSQAAQLALAHLPAIQVGLTRIVATKQYPISTVYLVEHSYSFDTTYDVVYNSANATFAGGIILEPTAGYYRFKVGTVITPEGMVRTTYLGGYEAIPDDIKEAVSYYVADGLMRLVNPYMASDIQMGKRRQTWQMALAKSPNVQLAETLLCRYRRMT
jgi:hypothetical protein